MNVDEKTYGGRTIGDEKGGKAGVEGRAVRGKRNDMKTKEMQQYE